MARLLPCALALLLVPAATAAQPAGSSLPAVPGGSGFEHQVPVVDGKRVALVIGNASYSGRGWRSLENAGNDAKQIATSLGDAALGGGRFDVTTVIDGDRQAILNAIDEFRRKARSADVALIYFSGHGFQYGDSHYLVPIGAPDGAVDAADVPQSFVAMEELLSSARGVRGIRMLFLDACRDGGAVITGGAGEVTKGTETTSPFGEISAPQFAVFYATGKGNKAYAFANAGDRISPFAAAVSRGIASEGMELGQLFQNVTYDVYRSTLHKRPPQQPHQEGSTYARFYFRPPVTAKDVQVAESAIRADVARAPAKLEIPHEELTLIDEPILAGRVLARHSPRELLQMAERGDPLATYLIGFMYSKGIGFELDRREARKWLEKAAAMDHPAGKLELGTFLLDPAYPVSADERAKAWRLVESASEANYPKAQSYLASSILLGSYGNPDKERARSLLERAATAGHPYALFAQGFYFGKKPQSMEKLRSLSSAGNLDGDHWLCIFAFGDSDAAAAAEYCGRAAKANFPNAKARFALLLASGKGVEPSPDRARYWAKEALLSPDLEPSYRPQMKQLAAN